MTKRRILTAMVAVVMLTGVLFVFSAYQYLLADLVVKKGVIYVRDENIKANVADLVADSVVGNKQALRRFSNRFNADSTIKRGRYVLKPGMTARQIINMFKSGRQTPVRMVLNPVRTPERLSAVVGKYLDIDSVSFLNLIRDTAVTSRYGFTPQTMIAMFMPNTYEFYWTMTPEAFMDRMKKEYDKFWNPEREAKLKKLGMTKNDVFTVASIINEETRDESEMQRIAGVYLNRLRIGMPLQADPTVKFAIGDFSIKRVTGNHLIFDSPYNTYKYAGLPPGPICIPTAVAIDAVLDYEKHDFLYFCAKEDFSGSHNFARTLPEHSKNARKYARALNQAGIK